MTFMFFFQMQKVKVWFQNRRIKWRKHHLEITQQRLAMIRQRQLTTNATTSNSDSVLDTEASSDNIRIDSPDLAVCSDSVSSSDAE